MTTPTSFSFRRKINIHQLLKYELAKGVKSGKIYLKNYLKWKALTNVHYICSVITKIQKFIFDYKNYLQV